MGFGPPPDGLSADVDHAGVEVNLDVRVRITEWEVQLGDEVLALTDLTYCRVADSIRNPGRYALILKDADRTIRVGVGYPPAHLYWVETVLREAEQTRARREGVAGREYLFERVVPDEVKELIDR